MSSVTETKMFRPYFSEWLVQQYFRGWWLACVPPLAAAYYWIC